MACNTLTLCIVLNLCLDADSEHGSAANGFVGYRSGVTGSGLLAVAFTLPLFP